MPLETDSSLEEIGEVMDEMWEGYKWITTISLRAKEFGSGELDRFLDHFCIQLKK